MRSCAPCRQVLQGWRAMPSCNRAEEARRRVLPTLFQRGPESERIRAFCFVQPIGLHGAAGPGDRWIAPPSGGRSLTSCRKATSVLADGPSCNLRGCSSAGRARPRHGRGHEFEARHPLHFGCVLALRRRDSARVGAARDVPGRSPERTGPRAARRLVAFVKRQCSRLGTAEVETMLPWLSRRRRQTCRVRLDG